MQLGNFDDPASMALASKRFLAALDGNPFVEAVQDPEEWMACGHHVKFQSVHSDGRRVCRHCDRLQSKMARLPLQIESAKEKVQRLEREAKALGVIK